MIRVSAFRFGLINISEEAIFKTCHLRKIYSAKNLSFSFPSKNFPAFLSGIFSIFCRAISCAEDILVIAQLPHQAYLYSCNILSNVTLIIPTNTIIYALLEQTIKISKERAYYNTVKSYVFHYWFQRRFLVTRLKAKQRRRYQIDNTC